MHLVSRRQCLTAIGGGAVSVLFGGFGPSRRQLRAQPDAPATYDLEVGLADGTILLVNRLRQNSPPTALELLLQAAGQTAIATTRDESRGILVTGIGAVQQTATLYWYYWVNDQLAEVGVSRRVLAPGDRVKWLLAPRASGSLFVRGDANGDGAVDVSDPIATLLHLYRGQPLPCGDAADADDDGQVRQADSIFLFNTLLRGGPLPPSPYPWSGLDPTPDRLGCGR